MKKSLITFFEVLFFVLLGAWAGPQVFTFWETMQRWQSGNTLIYQSQTSEQSDASAVTSLGWAQLLPPQEKQLLQHYQVDVPLDLETQVLRSIQASTDNEFKAAMHSANIVDDWIDQKVSLPGFIVPLEVGPERQLLSFFLVPYFGACLHFPPPPPNQMVFVRLDDGISMPDINQAYQLTGVLTDGLYEDPLGTAAYELTPEKIALFFDQPDDFRRHQG